MIHGGVINLASTSTVSARGCTFTGNSATQGSGGAINAETADNVICLNGCDVSSNVSSGPPPDNGGAIFNRSSSSSFTGCTFTSNTGGRGGAISNRSATPSIAGCTFTNNHGTLGGGIATRFSSVPTVKGCTFTGNTAGAGGAIRGFDGGAAHLIDCTFTDNSATAVGGAVVIDSSAAVLTISGCNFDGNTAGPGGGGSAGGAIHVLAPAPSISITDSVFTLNTSETGGGAIFIPDAINSIAVAGCTFTENSSNTGGAVYNQTDMTSFTDCEFTGNDAMNGGALANENGASALITDCTFTDNTGFQGGAIRNLNSSATVTGCSFSGNFATSEGGACMNLASSPIFTDCSFTGNSSDSQGGAIVNLSSAPQFTGCTFTGNSAVSTGGAVVNSSSSPDFTNCAFAGNSGADGGAIRSTSDTSIPTLTNCGLSGNFADIRGGALSNVAGATATLTNCSLSGNAAGTNGGAIYSESPGGSPATTTLVNTIAWNNRAGGLTSTISASIHLVGGAVADYTHCLVHNLDLTGTGVGNLDGADSLGAPHFLLPVDSAAAPTIAGNLRLAVGSPALDAGDNLSNSEPLDLDGMTRIQNTTIDLGAYEGAFIPDDTDGDCMPDNWEFAHTSPPSIIDLDPASDDDNDSLNALLEFAQGLDPNVPNVADEYQVIETVEVAGFDHLAVTFRTNPSAAPFFDLLSARSIDLAATDPWETTETMFGTSLGVWTTDISIFPKDPQAIEFLRVQVTK